MNAFVNQRLSPLLDTKDFKGKGNNPLLKHAEQVLTELMERMRQIAFESQQQHHLLCDLRFYTNRDSVKSHQVPIPQFRWRSTIIPRSYIDFTTIKKRMAGMPKAIQDNIVEMEYQRITLMNAARIVRYSLMLILEEQQQLRALFPAKAHIVPVSEEAKYKMQQQHRHQEL